jgi:hypothetical protein
VAGPAWPEPPQIESTTYLVTAGQADRITPCGARRDRAARDAMRGPARAEGRKDVRDRRLEPRSYDARAYWLSVAAVLALIAIVSVAGTTAVAGVLPAVPTPAPLVTRTVGRPALGHPPGLGQPPADTTLPSPGEGVGRPRTLDRVRLRQTVLVHTAPSADAPRPAISLLGEGMVAAVLDRQGDWVLIEYGPLTGWTRADTVEEID